MTYIPSSKDEAHFLENFDAAKYQNPGVAADTALFAVNGDDVFLLLIERGGYPYKGKWALPGGFVNLDEDLPDSARRELKEETDIDIDYIEQCAVWAKPNRDPRQRVITVSFIALTDADTVSAKAGDDASKAEWFKISEYEKIIGEANSHLRYTISGSTNMSAEVTFPNDRIQEIAAIKSGGLAFDHAESIAVSIELLKQRAAVISKLSLPKEKAAIAAKTIQNL